MEQLDGQPAQLAARCSGQIGMGVRADHSQHDKLWHVAHHAHVGGPRSDPDRNIHLLHAAVRYDEQAASWEAENVNEYFAAQAAAQPIVSDPVAISLITAVGGAVVAYLTYVKSQKVQAKKAEGKPKDRMELVIEGYEKLIVQKDAQNERDARQIKAMAEEMDLMRQLMRKLETQLNDSTDAHERAVRENTELKDQIKRLRSEYAATKKSAA